MAAVMRGLEAEAYDRQYNDKELLSRIWHYFRPHKRKIWIIVISIFLLSATSAAVPIIVSNGVNVMADGADDSLIPALIGVVFAIGVGVWLLNWVRRQLSTEIIADMILAIRTDSFDASARKDLSFYDEFSTGRIVSRITGDTQEFGEVLILAMDVVSQLTVAFILIFALFSIQWQLTLVVLSMAPFVVLASLGFRRLARRVTQQSSRALGEVNKSIQEAVTGIRVAKNYRQEQAIYDEFKAINR
ncbi:MAG: ABC transporter ATP-binding protein, partial [Chloroflexi bacterium]